MSQKPVYLNKNENRFGPAPECLEALRNASLEEISEYPMRSEETLSKALAKRYNLPEERIILGNGAEEILIRVLSIYLTENGKALVPSHSWWYYGEIIGRSLSTTVEYPIIKKADEYGYDYDKLHEIVRAERPDAVIICSPNNPTGNRFEVSEVERLAKKRPEILIVTDEAYEGFSNNGDASLELVSKCPNIVVVRSFSKLFALAGIRVGWAALSEEPYKKTARFFDRYLGFNALGEKLALISLKAEDYLKANAAKIAAERERYYQAVAGNPKITAFKSHTNFVLIEFAKDLFEKFKEEVERKGVVVRYFEEPEFKNCARITIGLPHENDLVIDTLKKL